MAQSCQCRAIHIPTGLADRAKGMLAFTFTSFLAITGSLPMTSLKNVKKGKHQDHERVFAFSSGLLLVSEALEFQSNILF